MKNNLSYLDRMREVRKYDISFEPKSFWNYRIRTNLDKLISDPTSKKSSEKSKEVDWVLVGDGGYLSKFVTENCKRVIEYWSKEGDTVLDPFSGRTRGLVSTILNRNYIGFDVISNNLTHLLSEYYLNFKPTYNLESNLKVIHKSSEFILDYIDEKSVDLIYTCPPYWTVERYKSVEGQLSDYTNYNKFLEVYKKILLNSCETLKEGGFFCIVVSNFRRNGKLIDFRSDTSSILKEKLELFDEVILEMSPAKRHPLYPQAINNLNMLKTHEYLLVFRKKGKTQDLIRINNEINFSRPLVKDSQTGSGKETLFWKDKIDFIDEKFRNK